MCCSSHASSTRLYLHRKVDLEVGLSERCCPSATKVLKPNSDKHAAAYSHRRHVLAVRVRRATHGGLCCTSVRSVCCGHAMVCAAGLKLGGGSCLVGVA